MDWLLSRRPGIDTTLGEPSRWKISCKTRMWFPSACQSRWHQKAYTLLTLHPRFAFEQRWLMTLAISLSPPMWIWCHQISANSVIARKSSRTSFTFGTCLHRPLHLGFCGASALFIRVHRALEHYQSYGNADKTEVLALHVALVHFQLCSTLRAVETRRSLSISSQLRLGY